MTLNSYNGIANMEQKDLLQTITDYKNKLIKRCLENIELAKGEIHKDIFDAQQCAWYNGQANAIIEVINDLEEIIKGESKEK